MHRGYDMQMLRDWVLYNFKYAFVLVYYHRLTLVIYLDHIALTTGPLVNTHRLSINDKSDKITSKHAFCGSIPEI